MSYLYSLYDALVSIAVPSDKARAVVDAMEHDMGATLATKPDIENLRLGMKADLELLRHQIAGLKQEMDSRFAMQDQKFDSLELRLFVKLGSLMAAGFGLTITALRLLG